MDIENNVMITGWGGVWMKVEEGIRRGDKW